MSEMSHIANERLWRGQSQSERAGARRARLLGAAFELVSEAGAPVVTVRAVCRRANLNPRYFYESFADLDALLAAVFDEILGETVTKTLTAIEQAPPTAEAKVRAALDTAFRSLTNERWRLQFVLADALGNPALAERRLEAVRLAAGLMADQAAGFYDVPRDGAMLQSSVFMLAGGLMELLIAWHNGSVRITIDELIDHAVLLTVGTSRAVGQLAPVKSRPRPPYRSARAAPS